MKHMWLGFHFLWTVLAGRPLLSPGRWGPAATQAGYQLL